MLVICTKKRSANDVRAPPPCEKIQLMMSLYFCEVPLKIRFAMLRVESVPHSIAEPGKPWTRLTQQLASAG